MHRNFEAESPQDQEPSTEATDRERFKRQLRLELELASAKQWGIAEDLGVDSTLISHWKEEGLGRNCMPAHWLPRWTRIVGPGLLRWIARQAGYDLVPRGDSYHGRVVPSFENLLGQFSTIGGEAMGKAFYDAAINGGEWKPTDLALWKKIQSCVNSIVEVMELWARKKGCQP